MKSNQIIYIAINYDNYLLYVGLCRRDDNIAQRFKQVMRHNKELPPFNWVYKVYQGSYDFEQIGGYMRWYLSEVPDVKKFKILNKKYSDYILFYKGFNR